MFAVHFDKTFDGSKGVFVQVEYRKDQIQRTLPY